MKIVQSCQCQGEEVVKLARLVFLQSMQLEAEQKLDAQRLAWIIDINHSSSTQLLQVKGQRAFAAELQRKELENLATAGFHGS